MGGLVLAFRLLRVNQWVKNGLVFAAPIASGTFGSPNDWVQLIGAFVCLCCVSSSLYILNDVHDAGEDRNHPTKKERPVASGAISVRRALVISFLMGALGICSAFFLQPEFGFLALSYVVITVAYTFVLREFGLLDLLCVASGFVIRTLAGSLVFNVPASRWFLIFSGAGSLLVVTAKRISELQNGVNRAMAGTRNILKLYNREYLLSLCSVFGTVTIFAYVSWCFDPVEYARISEASRLLSCIPVLLLVMQIIRLAEAGGIESPERTFFRDKIIFNSAVLTVVTNLLGLYF